MEKSCILCKHMIFCAIANIIVFPFVYTNTYAVEPKLQRTMPLSIEPAPDIVSFKSKEYNSRIITWHDREYGIQELIPILVKEVCSEQIKSDKRNDALNELNKLATYISGTQWIPDLISRYNTLDDLEEKESTVRCLMISEDPRTFQLFYNILKKEHQPVLRVRAALGLAKWNVRIGVRELIELFPSKVKSNRFEVGVSARRSFTSLNKYRKQWGCPEEEIDARAVAVLNQESEEAAIAELMRGFRKWFAENKHRFPEWKPGDPLPKVEEKDNAD